MSVNLSVVHHYFDGKFDSAMSREQQDVQSFADGNLQHDLCLSNWRVN